MELSVCGAIIAEGGTKMRLVRLTPILFAAALPALANLTYTCDPTSRCERRDSIFCRIELVPSSEAYGAAGKRRLASQEINCASVS